MGKKKNKRFGAAKQDPTGLSSVNVVENEIVNESSSSTIADVLDQLQSPEESTRECGCGTLAALVAQNGALPMLLGHNVVRILAPLVIDPSPYVRHRALGALRNMTVDGGLDVCEEMVLKDVLTPLMALFKQYGANWEPEQGQTKHTDTQLDIFTQAVHVLWNLSEASDVAVTVFNKEQLLPLLLPCLQHSVYGYPLATAVAQCLQTVTESNSQAAELCGGDDVLSLLTSLTNNTDSSSHAMLFQAALIGILVNIMGGNLVNSPSLPAFVVSLSHILNVNTTELITKYASKTLPPQNGLPQEDTDMEHDHQSHTLLEEETVPSDEDYQDIVNTIDAQRLSLELVTNMCCSPDEQWEEIDSSESGSSDEMSGGYIEEDIGVDNNNFEQMCAPSEVHAAFAANKILDKVVHQSCPLPAEVLAQVSSHRWGRRIINKLTRLRIHALLCINNLIEGIPSDTVGIHEVLQQLWDALSVQLKTKASGQGASAVPTTPTTNGVTDGDLLEASTSAMRAVIDKLAQLDCAISVEGLVANIHFLMQLAEGAASSVQIHVVRMMAATALLAVRTNPLHPVLQEFGERLVTVATHSTDLVVAAEALDALFDMFAEDATDPIALTLQLSEKLRPIVPLLRTKLQSQKKSLGENYVTVSTARTNLIRFIKYLESKKKVKTSQH